MHAPSPFLTLFLPITLLLSSELFSLLVYFVELQSPLLGCTLHEDRDFYLFRYNSLNPCLAKAGTQQYMNE